MQAQTYRFHNAAVGLIAAGYLWFRAPPDYQYGWVVVPAIGYLIVIVASLVVSVFATTIPLQRAVGVANRLELVWYVIAAISLVHFEYLRVASGMFAPLGPLVAMFVFVGVYGTLYGLGFYVGSAGKTGALCSTCGYPNASTGRCPECGEALPPQPANDSRNT